MQTDAVSLYNIDCIVSMMVDEVYSSDRCYCNAVISSFCWSFYHQAPIITIVMCLEVDYLWLRLDAVIHHDLVLISCANDLV